MGDVGPERTQRLEPVNRRRPEAHGARIVVIATYGRHFADLETKSCRLDQDLGVEHEVVAVLEEWNRLQKSS